MRRQLQIKDGIAVAEWVGTGGMPLPPSEEWLFLDVTDRPEARCGDFYDEERDAFSPPPPPARPIDKLSIIEGKVDQILRKLP